VLRVLRDPRAVRDLPDLLDSLERLVLKDLLVLPDQQVLREHKDRPVSQGSQAPKEHKDLLVLLERLVLRDPKVFRVLPELQD
jgi:hypothetical protein